MRFLFLLLAILPGMAATSAPRVEGGPRTTGRPLVVIDPGHGGRDPGALAADGTREKDVTMAVSRAIPDALVRSGRVRVVLTRDDDRAVALTERAGIARRLDAALLVSVHADSAPNRVARGASLYTLSDTASDDQAARLAARENGADRVAGLDLGARPAIVRSILADLTLRRTMAASAAFAQLVPLEAKGAVRFRARSHRFADFAVLRAGVPAVLFETGYLSNAEDAAFLASAAGRRAIAEGARRAIEVHLARTSARR